MGLRNWCQQQWAETREASVELWTFARTHNWKRSARNSVKRKYWVWWSLLLALIAIMVLAALYRETIIHWLQPHKEEIVATSCTWLVPIAILVVLSIPPLGGHEIILLLIGMFWGFYIGMGIATAGTFFGEMMCFFVFRYYFTEKAQEIEQGSVFYACIARLMGQGGVTMVTLIRYSAIPGHVITALQSTVGMSIWVYMVAVLLSMPKGFAFVFLGVALGRVHGDATPEQLQEQSLINWAVTIGVALATILSLFITYIRARRLYPIILAESSARRVEKGEGAEFEVLNVSLAEATMDGVDAQGDFGNLSDEEEERKWRTRGEQELKFKPAEGRSWQDGPTSKAEDEERRRARRIEEKEREAEEEIERIARVEATQKADKKRYGERYDERESGDEDEAAPRYDELSLLSRKDSERKRRDSKGGNEGW